MTFSGDRWVYTLSTNQRFTALMLISEARGQNMTFSLLTKNKIQNRWINAVKNQSHDLQINVMQIGGSAPFQA